MSDLSALSSRAIVGMFYQTLEEMRNQGWWNQIGFASSSNQESETYKWLGFSPALREWLGGKNAKGLRENGITIANKKYEATLAIAADDMRRDKTHQLRVRIGELADRANQHWAKLLSALILLGETTACYDGQYFFDTDHSEGESGTQTNDLAAGDYAALNVGTATNPTADELADVIMALLGHQYGYKDDQGEPMNEGAKSFVLHVPISFWGAAQVALTKSNLNTGTGVRENPLLNNGFSITPIANPRLTWTTKLALFRTDGRAKPFILQSEKEPVMSVLGEGSDHLFKNDEYLFSVDAIRNVGFGYWQHATLATLS